MAKPIIKSLSANSFLDGSVVYENDARIGGELDGNVEIADLSEPRSQYNMTIGPVYYGPDSTVVTAGISTDWESPGVAMCVFMAPRDLVIRRLQAYVYNSISLGTADQFVVKVEALSLEEAKLGPSGAYKTTSSGWVVGPFVTVTGVGGSGVIFGASDTWASSYAAGTFIRVFLESNYAGGSTASKNRPQAEVVVTLTIEEDHAE